MGADSRGRIRFRRPIVIDLKSMGRLECGQEEVPMAAPIKLAHVVFRTGNLARMRDWYCSVLEARVVFENAFIAFATYDDEHHRIAFVDLKAIEQPAPNALGIEHIAFTYASLGD